MIEIPSPSGSGGSGGSDTVNELSYLIAKASAAQVITSAASGSALVIDQTVSSFGSSISNDGGGVYTLSAGTYSLDAFLALGTDGGEFNEDIGFYNITDGAFIGIMGNYRDFAGDSSQHANNPSAVIRVASPTQIDCRFVTAGDANLDTLREQSGIKIVQLFSESSTSLEGATPDYLIGSIWQGAYPSLSASILLMGTTFNWSDHPKLNSLHAANPSGFITDNGDGTATVVNHTDFIRAGTTDIGTHVDDSTAVNGLSGTVITASDNVTTNNNGGSGSIVKTTRTRSVTLTGDTETAPHHRKAYFGIYGDG